ncbi:MAG: ATP-binding protein [Succinivibrio sp.]|nr:ATP-binding protein [Succinivibrio sp.]
MDETLRQALGLFKAVCLEGPKWCGKTWTGVKHSHSQFFIGDPQGNFAHRELARSDPAFALKGEAPRLLDEWQEVPALWDAVRFSVDQRVESGQFILTGSATPRFKGITHSGTGRIALLKMQTMSLYESGISNGAVSLQSLFDGNADLPAQVTPLGIEELAELVVRGGWPGNLTTPAAHCGALPQMYIENVLRDDLLRLDAPRIDGGKMRQLLRSLARNESTASGVATLKRDLNEQDGISLDEKTIKSYLTILNQLFLIENQPSFATALRSPVPIKNKAKLHLCDPSLACALLGAGVERLLSEPKTLGFMFEALVERDLRIYASYLGGELLHYQDYKGREIDAVLRLPDGRWGAFEIKLGNDKADLAALSLRKTASSIAPEGSPEYPSLLAVICGTAPFAYRRDDGVYVLPPGVLKP